MPLTSIRVASNQSTAVLSLGEGWTWINLTIRALKTARVKESTAMHWMVVQDTFEIIN